MMFPMGTDRPLRRPTRVTYGLLVFTVLVFLGQTYMQFAQSEQYETQLRRFCVWRQDFHWYQLITSTFLHAGLLHLASNCLFLWVFGPNIEDRLGRGAFLAFYLLGGAAAMGAHAATDPNPALGASGAVCALTGAYLVQFPRTTIRAFSLLFVIGIVQLPAWWFIGLSVVWDIASQIRGMSRIAHTAHLGGYVFGGAVAFGLLWLKWLPREPYDLFHDVRQRLRRREIRQSRLAFEKLKTTRLDPTRRAASDDVADALADKRADVSRLLASGDVAGAASAYRLLADTYGHLPRAAVLNRKAQYDLANAIFARGEFPLAAYAYERFLEAYPTDAEGPRVRLLLGRVLARELNDPVRAKVLLAQAIADLRDDDELGLARQELAALG
jgi:membrane associated rhomboid family serine protease